MCVLFFAYDVHPRYRLILAANRDEFYARPAAPLQYWRDYPEVLAGRDLEAMGTWMGITTYGRFAALTNYRDPKAVKKNALSRGNLVADYLTGHAAPEEYLRKISALMEQVNGFNLVVGDRHSLYYASNRGDRLRLLQPGVYGVSNHLLNAPWPKVDLGIERLQNLVSRKNVQLVDELEDMLQNQDIPSDDLLPDTGVGLVWERLLAPIFISSASYGTRCSTIMTIGRDSTVFIKEITWKQAQESPIPETSHEYALQPA